MNSTLDKHSELETFLLLSNFICVLSLLFGFSSIFVIVRYTTRSMLNYRFHLLNMSITILLSDFCISFLFRPRGIFPGTGLCMVGVLNPWLTRTFGYEFSFYLTAEAFIYVMAVNIGSFTNATIHRYVSLTKLLHPIPLLFTPRFLTPIMIWIQFIWPALSVLFIGKLNLRPENGVKSNFELHPEVINQTQDQPCILISSNFFELFYDLIYLLPTILQGAPCVWISMSILFHCWWKIKKVQQNQRISIRTLNMQRRLMIALVVQTFIPNAIIVCCICSYALGLVLNFQIFEIISGSLAFHIGSMHSIINFILMCISIPAYKKGIREDLKYMFTFNNDKPTRRMFMVTSGYASNQL